MLLNASESFFAALMAACLWPSEAEVDTALNAEKEVVQLCVDRPVAGDVRGQWNRYAGRGGTAKKFTRGRSASLQGRLLRVPIAAHAGLRLNLSIEQVAHHLRDAAAFAPVPSGLQCPSSSPG